MDFKKILRTTIKIVLPLALGFVLLWYLYRDMDFAEIWQVINKGVRYDIILFSLLFGLIANIIRSFRWGLLIKSLGENFKISNLIYAVLGNYTINLILPRVGEVWRCGVVAKYEKISFSKLFGTLLIDRVSDSIVVGLVTSLIVVFNFEFFARFFSKNPDFVEGVQRNLSSAWLYVVILTVAALLWYTFTYLKHIALVQKALDMIKNIWEGMKSVWMMETKVRFLIQTMLIWINYFLFFYITFYAFDFTRDLGAGVGLIAFTMSSIAVAAPVQGGIGAWHFMVIATLICYGVKESDAAAFALVVHTVQTIWTGLCGMIAIVALPLTNKEKPPISAE